MWDQRGSVGEKGKLRPDRPVMIVGTLNGTRVRLSTANFLPTEKARDMEAARNLAILWERTGKVVRPDEYSPLEES